MWIIVTKILQKGRYKGWLMNEPLYKHKPPLKEGDLILFHDSEIYDITRREEYLEYNYF